MTAKYGCYAAAPYIESKHEYPNVSMHAGLVESYFTHVTNMVSCMRTLEQVTVLSLNIA